MTSDQGSDAAVRLAVYAGFVENGRAPVPAELAAATGLGQRAVEESLGRLAAGRVLVLAPGTSLIWMAAPFSAVPTPFRVEVGGRSWFGNCIWDALGVVAALGGSGVVRTWCPDCRAEMSVAVHDGELATADGVVHFAVPAARWWDDIGFT